MERTLVLIKPNEIERKLMVKLYLYIKIKILILVM
jgi:nucleoside diphosphate kinase